MFSYGSGGTITFQTFLSISHSDVFLSDLPCDKPMHQTPISAFNSLMWKAPDILRMVCCHPHRRYIEQYSKGRRLVPRLIMSYSPGPVKSYKHDEVITWKLFPHYWPLRGEYTDDRWIPLPLNWDAMMKNIAKHNNEIPVGENHLRRYVFPLWHSCS